MDKQKQIEEIADALYNSKYEYDLSNPFEIAKVVIGLGYSKIPEGAVVLTRGEQQRYAAYKIIEPQIRGCLDRERELEKRLETVRKETAEEFAERLKEKLTHPLDNPLHGVIDEICKEMVDGK